MATPQTNSLLPDPSEDPAQAMLSNNNQPDTSFTPTTYPSGTYQNSQGLIAGGIGSVTPADYQAPGGVQSLGNLQNTMSEGASGTPSSSPSPSPTPTPAPAPTPTPTPTTPPTPPTSSAAGLTPSGYTPTLGTVSDKETVSGQVNDLLNKDNPIMQTARSQALSAANSRGLLNSSMAVQAGEQAAINSALPIATQDAATYHDTATRNQEASNTGGQFNSNAANQLQLQGLRGDQAGQVANIEANYKTLMQTSASATQLFTESTKAIGAILDDPNTTQEQKQAAIDKQLALLQSGLSAIGSTGNVDLTSLLDFSGVSPTPGVAGNPAATPPAAGAPPASQPGQPAPAGTPGAGHNVGEQFVDGSSGWTVQVMPDGSLQQLTGPYSG